MLLMNGNGLLQFEDLQEAYLTRRRQVARKERHRQFQESVKKEAVKGVESFQDGLEDFESVLSAFTRYRYMMLLYQK